MKQKPIQPISLVLVVHQEAGSIKEVIKEFHEKVLSKIPDSECIVCEDGSTDGTKDILRSIEDTYHLTLDMREGKRGYTNAMRDGLKAAKNPIIFFSDSDGQHDPDDFWKMYEKLQDADMVVGWKKERKDALYRLVLTYAFNAFIGWYFNVRLHDSNCGFRLMKRTLVDFLLTQEWRLQYCNNAELSVKAVYGGFTVTEVPVSHFPRRFGISRGLPVKKLPKIILHILKNLLLIKKTLPKKLPN